MNILVMSVFPNYFNATGLADALEDCQGHEVLQAAHLGSGGGKKYYEWGTHSKVFEMRNLANLKEAVKTADCIIVCGMMVFHIWNQIRLQINSAGIVYKNTDAFWADVPDKTKVIGIVSDSAILERDWSDVLQRFDAIFAMPDLFDYVHHERLYPALQVNTAFHAPHEPRDKVVIGHSPGNKMASNRKGTDEISDVLGDLSQTYNFEFRVLADMTHEQCVTAKGDMDIFIDQLQDPPHSTIMDGLPPFLGALGKSGQEAMCNGCATITSANLVSTEPYFPNPPVIIANRKAILRYEVENLLRYPRYRYHKATEQYEWASEYLTAEFVSRYINRGINGTLSS
jgi:hypothetical protein